MYTYTRKLYVYMYVYIYIYKYVAKMCIRACRSLLAVFAAIREITLNVVNSHQAKDKNKLGVQQTAPRLFAKAHGIHIHISPAGIRMLLLLLLSASLSSSASGIVYVCNMLA